MTDSLAPYKFLIEKKLEELNLPEAPSNLYEPITYFLNLGGKRMRPILALLSTKMFGGEYQEAVGAALCVELFHNFSLVHDDIMDAAPLRRGKATVHHKWNPNIAILSGDALLIEAYKQLEGYNDKHFKALVSLFNKTAIEVCEGQQMDMDFESRDDVSLSEYIEMIRLKTAVLLGCSLKMGAILANASNDDAIRIYNFGVNLGIAFQIQDDFLDAFGHDTKVGKQVGGDILAKKKTYLLLKAFEDANTEQKMALTNVLNSEQEKDKVKHVLAIFNDLDIPSKTTSKMEEFHALALKNLEEIQTSEELKTPLYALTAFLFSREF